MDSNYIEQLLERYWQCDTSQEEDAQLRSYFNNEAVPALAPLQGSVRISGVPATRRLGRGFRPEGAGAGRSTCC